MLLFATTLIVLMFLHGRFYLLFTEQYFHLDESFNLIKALLLDRGFRLYTDIWSDQPSVSSYVFALVYKFFGNQVFYYRLLVFSLFVISFSFLMLILRKYSGMIAVCFALAAVIMSPELVHFAVVANIGVPSLSLAMLAAYFALAHKDSKTCLSLSVIFMTLSLGTKFWSAIIFLSILIHLFIESKAKKKITTPLLYAGGVCFSLCVVFFFSIDSYRHFIDQLLLPHFQMSKQTELPNMLELGRGKYWTYLLAGASVSSVLVIMKNSFLFPAVWFLTATSAFLFYRPFWEHHITIIQIPAAILFGMTCSELIKNFGSFKEHFIRFLFLSGSVAAFAVYYFCNLLNHDFSMPVSKYREVPYENFRDLSAKKDKIKFIYSDVPYIAFLLDRPVPPELAVISKKRIDSGNLTAHFAALSIHKYEPEVLWMQRFNDQFGTELVKELADLAAGYVPLYARRPVKLYALHSLEWQNIELNFDSAEQLAKLKLNCFGAECSKNLNSNILRDSKAAAEINLDIPAGSLFAEAKLPLEFDLGRYSKQSSKWLRFSLFIPEESFRGSTVKIYFRSKRPDAYEENNVGLELNSKGITELSVAGDNKLIKLFSEQKFSNRWLDFIVHQNRGKNSFRIWLNSYLVFSGENLSFEFFPQIVYSTKRRASSRFFIDAIAAGSHAKAIARSDRLLTISKTNSKMLTSRTVAKFFPIYPQTVNKIDSTIVLKRGESLRGNESLYLWSGSGSCDQQEGQPPILRLMGDNTLSNLSILNAPDGIHVEGSNVRIDNVKFLNVCEDAITVKRGKNVDIVNSHFYGCSDKAIQVNGGESVNIKNNTFVFCAHPVLIEERAQNSGLLITVKDNLFFKVIRSIYPEHIRTKIEDYNIWYREAEQ